MHSHSVRQDLTGQRFGLLVVLRRAPNQTLPSGQHQIMWECQCDCGCVVVVRGTHLKDGFTRSCGCVKSHGERTTAEYLKSKNVVFQREYCFSDCVNSKGNKVKFDFAIMNDSHLIGLIEYQGQQHFEEISRNTSFGKMQREETDQLKKEYCLTHNIPLYEIRYDDDIPNRVDEIINMLHDNTVPSSEENSGKV
jgi:hypothetical protein